MIQFDGLRWDFHKKIFKSLVFNFSKMIRVKQHRFKKSWRINISSGTLIMRIDLHLEKTICLYNLGGGVSDWLNLTNWILKKLFTSVRSFLISDVSSSHCCVYCHFAVFSLSTICNKCKCFCSSSSFCNDNLLKLEWRKILEKNLTNH